MTYELKNSFTIVVGDDSKAIDDLPLVHHVKLHGGIPSMIEIYHHSKYIKIMDGIFKMVKHNINLNQLDYKIWLRVTTIDVLKAFVETYSSTKTPIETRVVRFTIGQPPVEIDAERVCRLINEGREIR